MDLFSIFQTIMDYSFCLSLRELILVLVIVFHLGYFFGKLQSEIHYVGKDQCQEGQNSGLLALTCANQVMKSQESQKEHHSEPIKQQPSQTILEHSLPKSSQLLQTQPIKPRLTHSASQPQPLPSTQPQQNNISREFLSQKISVDGRRIQSRGIFHMTFQKATNPKFLRKIQKHQIITDYEIAGESTQDSEGNNLQLIPFSGGRKSFQLTDDSSILEISTYENLRLQKYPIIEKRLIKTHEFSNITQNNFGNHDNLNMNPQPYIPVSPSLCENGKFMKFFKNQRKIGEGAFGTVYQVMNIFQGKEYAVKKLFINHKNQVSAEKMELILNESIRQVNILSQYSHPNIVRFYTCWLQIANLNESITFNKMHYLSSSRSIRSSLIQQADSNNILTDSRITFKKRKSKQDLQSCLQVSYVSSVAENSGFAFQKVQENQSIDGQVEIRDGSYVDKINNQLQDCQILQLCGENIKQPKLTKKKSSQYFVPIFALYIQMQLCKQGSLDTYLHRRQCVNRTFSFLIIHQLLKGVQYLHSNGLIHRDLKPGNILINKKQRLIKIGDFGLSVRINQNIQYGKVGTPSYIAPQIVQKRPIKKQDLPLIDVYSIGVIYYQLLNLFNFTTKHEKLQKINQLKFGTIDLHSDFKLQKKLIKLMTKSFNRITIKQIFQKKQYKELVQLLQTDRGIMDSWENIDGLSSVSN